MSDFHKKKEEARKQIRYSLTNEQIEQIRRDALEEGVKRGVQKGMDFFLGLGCAVLHNSYGFGKQRIQHFTERCLTMFARMDQEGCYTMEKILDFGLKYGDIDWHEEKDGKQTKKAATGAGTSNDGKGINIH